MCCEAVGQLEKVNNTSLKKHPGNTGLVDGRLVFPTDHPRVGGEHERKTGEGFLEHGSSPRGRGTRR